MSNTKVTPTGQIHMSDVNVELGRPWNQHIELNDSAVRSLAGKTSGQIAMSDLRGKSNATWVYLGRAAGYGQGMGGEAPTSAYGSLGHDMSTKYAMNLGQFFSGANDLFGAGNFGTRTVGNDRIVFVSGYISGGAAEIIVECWRFQ